MRANIIAAVSVVLIVGAIVVVIVQKSFFAGSPASGGSHREGALTEDVVRAKEYYTCPMHPTVRRAAPGACPICGMTLVKKFDEPRAGASYARATGGVSISPSTMVLANVATTQARIASLLSEVHAVGTIAYAEPNLRKISMRYPGRLDRLYLTYTGQRVRKGDPVADVYSPEAISAQQEYLLAKESYDSVINQAELISAGAKNLLEQSREKLLRWGFTEAQISEIDVSQQAQSTLTIYSPIDGTVVKKYVDPQHYALAGEDLYEVADLSTVWMYADVYENEIRLISIGQKVAATSESYPGKSFAGSVTFISPAIDPTSRTVRVRAEFPNPRGELRIDMFLSTTISVHLPRAIVVPSGALLSFGTRKVVWVQKGPGMFEPRQVITGLRSGDDTQILEGIAEGDTVVASGGYLLDSESQMQAPSGSETTQRR